MTCPKCKKTGILNQANGKDFYYCRVCKEEIFLEETPKAEADITQEEIDAIFNAFYWIGMASQSPYKPYVTLEEYEQECLSISPHWSDE